jgi:hypothetical protein
MPYDASRLDSNQPATDPEATYLSDGTNPFLQFVDPLTHRELVERAVRNTGIGRLITPLSRLQHERTGSAELGRAWDEELADDKA